MENHIKETGRVTGQVSVATATRLLSGIALVVGMVCAPGQSSAQDVEVTGPLAGAPAVRHMRQHRVDRVQLIVPTMGYTLQDEFARSVITGLEVNYHFTDYLGVGVWGGMANFGGAVDLNTDLTSQVVTNGQATDRNRLSMPTSDGFADQIARLQGIASAHVIFAPLRGKLSLFQGAFVDTDFYILAGVALAFVEERADVTGDAAQNCTRGTDLSACEGTQTARQSRIAPAPMVGVGLNLYFNEFIGLALQWRAFPFTWNPAGTDESGFNALSQAGAGFPDGQIDGNDQRFYFHHMINIGLIINLPPDIALTE